MQIMGKLKLIEGKIRRCINKPKFEKEILILETESIYSSLESIIFKAIQCTNYNYEALRCQLSIFPEEYIIETLKIFRTEGIIAEENGRLCVSPDALRIAELFKSGKTDLTGEEYPTGRIRTMMENFSGIEKIRIYGDECESFRK